MDEEAGREAFTYVLESGRSGTIHVEQVLEYNQDPSYLRNLLLYRLTLPTLIAAVAAWSLSVVAAVRPSPMPRD